MNMEQNVIQRNMWNSAGKAGLVLGLASVLYLFITQWLGQTGLPAFASLMINGVLWVLKFIGCIWLMMFFMKKYVKETADADNSDTFRFGMATSLLSAIVYAAFSFANISFICPDIFAAQMDQIMQAYSSLLDSNTMSQMEKMIGNMPQITFFTNLIYCFLYGMILSFILSRNIPSKDPFADYKPDEQ